VKIVVARAKNDPEKMVLPGIIFTRKHGNGLSVYGLAAGWWDFHITLLWSRSHDRSS